MSLYNLPRIEVILPIFNEIENLPVLVKQLDQTIDKMRAVAQVSLLFVNDGSADGSKEFLTQLEVAREDVRVIHLIHNFGHSAAVTAGLDHFDADIAVVMDADLQDAPTAMQDMFDAWKKGSKTVVAARGERQEKNRALFNLFYFMLHKVAKGLPPINFGTHSLLDKEVVQRLRSLKERNRYFPGLVSFSSNDITPIYVDRGARANGESRVGFFGLVNLALTAFLSFSSTPVKMVSVLGIICSLASLGSGIGIISIKLFTDKAIPGWASMMTVMFFGSGLQLLCLGIIGEYIARIYDEVKQRPIYLVDQALSRSKRAQSQREMVYSAKPMADGLHR